ncbi:MAG: hypothetical protein MK116_06290 [Phycisphaerales bacterium]|nr:hypothetical protein [Phycisphaerales bacterium]
MADVPSLQPDDKNFHPGKEKPAYGIPNLQPDLSSRAPQTFYKWNVEGYPPESLPVIARSMPSHSLIVNVGLAIIVILTLLVMISNNYICGLSFFSFMSLVFVFPIALTYRTRAMQLKWFAWTVRHKDELCLDCGEPLHSLAEEGTCPKCTQPYSLESSRWGWRRWRSATNIPDQPPVRPGPLHQSKPRASILAGAPRAFRFIIIVEGLAALIGLLAYWSIARFFDMRGVSLLIMMAAILAIIWFLVDRPTRAAKKNAADVDHLLCPECTYRLDDREARGTCPECGFYYTFANCQWAWRHLRKDVNKPPTPPPRLIPGGRESQRAFPDG